MKLRANLAADGALVLTTLVWGTTFVVAKDVLDYWPPFSYLALRLTLAALLLWALFARRVARAGREEWKAGGALGLLIGVGFAGQTFGLTYTTPSKAAFITGLTTPLVPFVAFVVLRVRPNVENLIGVTLASVGGALILAPHGGGAGGANAGDLIVLACTALFATHMTLMSVYARRYDVRLLTALQIGVAAALMVCVWLAVQIFTGVFGADALPQAVTRGGAPLVWSARFLLQLCYLAGVATVLNFMLWTWGQARMSATHAAIIFSLEPVFATLIAVAVRGPGEWAGGRASVGAAFILAGVITSELRWSDGERRDGETRRRGDAATQDEAGAIPENEDDVEAGGEI